MLVSQEKHRIGLDYLHDVTLLLQRIRAAHPTAGLYEAADLQWWWAQRTRPTNELPQLFWFDELGRPGAAIVISESVGQVQLDPIVLPDSRPDWVAYVMERGLAYASQSGFETVFLEVDRTDEVLRHLLIGQGFRIEGDAVVETWMTADSRPEVSQLHDGYRLSSRLDAVQPHWHPHPHPHHMIKRNGPDVEARLRQTSLYRPDLDLVVYDSSDGVAAYGLFWYDPATATGLVEPMRTEDNHQRRGLARHILTTGIDLLAKAGAQRIKICFEPGNPASSHLYLSVGFEPDRTTVRCAGPTAQRAQ
jgi:GNAT superfamily N-acetyltransferase